MAMEATTGLMEENMLAIGWMIRFMDAAPILWRTAPHSLANLRLAR